ncbi:MAG: helix-turn-helix domain-containing protein [Vicinamibacterales bacterium]|nr:helix-turn-helix domain-containing protein [Vicinamibacterales bacterium]
MKRPPLVDLSSHPVSFVTVTDLATYLLVDERTILRMIEDGALHAVRVGRVWRIPLDEAQRVFPVERARHDARRIS